MFKFMEFVPRHSGDAIARKYKYDNTIGIGLQYWVDNIGLQFGI